MKLSVEWTVRLGVATLILASAPTGYSEVKENPYQVIIERNVFDVHPPPPQPVDNTPPPPPPLKTVVKLTGITTLGGTSKALVEITPEPGKPVDKQILKVGEGSSGIEILDIDVTNTTIKVRLGSSEFLVGFTNAPSAGGAVPNPALAMRPGMPAIPLPTQPGIVPGIPTAIPGAVPQPVPAYNPAASAYGNRGGITVGGAEVNPTAIPAPGVNPNYRAIPSRTLRTDAAGNPNAASMSSAEAQIHMELLRTMQQNRPGPPLPPTPLTPLNQ